MIYFLIGFMGAGKSTIAKQLSERTDIPSLDLDKLIEQKYGKAVQDLFREEGEEWFRQAESEVLRTIESESDLVVACGGGTPCFGDNMKWMNEKGETWYLRLSVGELLRRLDPEQISSRPLMKGLRPEEIKRVLEEMLISRERYYLQATRVISEENCHARYLERYLKPEIR